MPEQVQTKVLVIGGGLAGASAARSAVSFSDDVVLVDGGAFGRSGRTPYRATAISQHIPPSDFTGNPSVLVDTYVGDILEAGGYLNDQGLVDLSTEVCYDQVNWTEYFGFRVRDERLRRERGMETGKHQYLGSYPLFQTPGHSFPRTIPFEGNPHELLDTYRRALDLWSVRIFERVIVTRLLTEGGRVVGAFGIDAGTGTSYHFDARTTILCAGGASRLYAKHPGPSETTGDGCALTWDAGASLANMEFVQFSLYPVAGDATLLPHNDDLLYLGLGGKLLNASGDRFMLNAASVLDQIRMERAPVASLIAECQHEIESGRGPIKSPPVDFDLSPDGRKFLRSFDALNRPGYDWALDGVEWGIGVERLLGGVPVDYRLTTDLPALYAVGEAATGATGADCLPGFAFAFTIAAGFQAGAMAARAAVGFSHGALPPAMLRKEEERLARLGGDGPVLSDDERDALDREVRSLAWKGIGVTRVESELRAAQARFFEIAQDLARRRAPRLPAYLELLGLRNLALVGYLIATAGLERTESRGQHRRRDHQDRDDRIWLKEIRLKKGEDGRARVSHSAVRPLRYKSRHLAHFETTSATFPR